MSDTGLRVFGILLASVGLWAVLYCLIKGLSQWLM